eukprot:2615917-Rhodomonas_salina.2
MPACLFSTLPLSAARYLAVFRAIDQHSATDMVCVGRRNAWDNSLGKIGSWVPRTSAHGKRKL